MVGNDIINEQNRLLFTVIFFIYVLQVASYAIIEQRIDFLFPPYGAMLLIVLYFVIRFLKPAVAMWLILMIVFSYFVMYNWFYPYFVNLLFFYFGVLLASLYQQIRVITLYSALSFAGLLYFFQRNFDRMAATFEISDMTFFILFFIALSVYIVFHTKATKKLYNEARSNEETAKKALYSKNSYMDLFFEHAQDAIIVFDLDRRVIQVNPAFEKIYGWTKEEAIGNVLPLVPEEEIETANERTNRILNGESITSLHTRDRKKDGSLIDVEITLSPIFDDNGKIIAMSAITRDITFRKEAEKRLIQSEKLTLAGEMAAGVTHEIRNPLTVISGFIQMMNEDPDNPYKSYTVVMQSELKRINLIISEFLVLSRPHAVHRKPVLIQDLIEDTIVFFESELHLRNISLSSVVTHEKMVFAEENQLKQVLINLLKNAAESISGNGTITIHSDLVYDKDRKYISISITDTGQGIPEKLLDQIGEPFFTTKEKGTGLGMMISQKIIRSHNGFIDIQSQEGKGTSITLYLPADDPRK